MMHEEKKMRKNVFRELENITLLTLLFLFPIFFQWAHAQAEEPMSSLIAEYLQVYGYNMPKSLETTIVSNAIKKTIVIGEAEVTLYEALYDGEWLFTATSIRSTSPQHVLVMPGDAQPCDSAAGFYTESLRSDNQTFLQIAENNHMKLLGVYAYPKEFDNQASYFIDHLQKDDVTFFISGADIGSMADELSFEWSIQVYEIDTGTLNYEKLEEKNEATTVRIAQSIVEMKYTNEDFAESFPICEIALRKSAITTYCIPVWNENASSDDLTFLLFDENGNEIPKDFALSGYAFRFNSFPKKLLVQCTNPYASFESKLTSFVLE